MAGLFWFRKFVDENGGTYPPWNAIDLNSFARPTLGIYEGGSVAAWIDGADPRTTYSDQRCSQGYYNQTRANPVASDTTGYYEGYVPPEDEDENNDCGDDSDCVTSA